jgi:hypothetical protein
VSGQCSEAWTILLLYIIQSHAQTLWQD